ncbi:DUF6531 domain-containing protein [Hahella sp. NBU794]|uniref:DUF6531 domain-containing protein n=1 Tax=Hahella sp. NBU794 TaxID=3422590 RepID=UPI003D6E0A92
MKYFILSVLTTSSLLLSHASAKECGEWKYEGRFCNGYKEGPGSSYSDCVSKMDSNWSDGKFMRLVNFRYADQPAFAIYTYIWEGANCKPCNYTEWRANKGSCIPPSSEPNGPPSCKTGNPIDISTGNKYQEENDIYFSQELNFTRYYNSLDLRWRHSYSAKLIDSWTKIYVIEDSGRKSEFIYDQEKSAYIPITHLSTELYRGTANDDWRFVNEEGKEYSFDKLGALQEIIYPNKKKITITRDPTQSFIAKDEYGNQIKVELDGGYYLLSAELNESLRVEYVLDSDNPNNILKASNSNGNEKAYHYEDTRFPNALTGITDENDVRYATWTYNEDGKAVTSEHAGGVEKSTVIFNEDSSATVTTALGKKTTYHFERIHGVRKIVQVEGQESEHCLAANSTYTYDNKGFVDTVTDWEGSITDYDHNERGLEVKRTEAKGTPEERVTLTEWHPTLRLPTKINEPDRITEFTYDDDGKLKSKSIQPVAAN